MSYFDLNLDAAIWTVHKAAKTGKRYLVPLPHQAVEILQALKSTARSDFVFPNNRSNRRTISENTLNAAMRYLGFSSNQVCAHGFRTTASTILNEAGQWNSDAIERQLDHGFEPVRGIYARGKYWDERVEMMQKWADYLDQLRVTSKPGLIVPHLRAVA
jgi:integrase